MLTRSFVDSILLQLAFLLLHRFRENHLLPTLPPAFPPDEMAPILLLRGPRRHRNFLPERHRLFACFDRACPGPIVAGSVTASGARCTFEGHCGYRVRRLGPGCLHSGATYCRSATAPTIAEAKDWCYCGFYDGSIVRHLYCKGLIDCFP